jgi:hypothetical protein
MRSPTGLVDTTIAALQDEGASGKALLAQLLSFDGEDEEAWSVLRTAQAMAPCAVVRRAHARLLMKSCQHSMTNDGGGLPMGRWHVDRYHLISEALRRAFLQHLR